VNTYTYLDLTPLGRQAHVTQFSLHDAYASQQQQVGSVGRRPALPMIALAVGRK
jgi:hypothetical protein